MSQVDPIQALAGLVSEAAWLVGGAVRDQLLGRPTVDFDVAVQEDPQSLARRLARLVPAHPFKLSESFGGWRVVPRDDRWQLDLLPLVGGRIEHDLAARDLTVNAIARPLGGGELIDPCAGVEDLRAGILRMVSGTAFATDPLRCLRLVRLACELEFAIEPATAAGARAGARMLGGVAAERVFAELKQIVISERASKGLALMDELELTGAILPELTALQGVEQSRYHHLDVHGHTRAVLERTIALTRDPEPLFAEQAPAVAVVLAEPLADELTRGQALRFGALLHDIAKPQTRGVTAAGRVTFMGHDEAGAAVAVALLRRLRASERLAEYVAALVRHHLRLGFLVHEMPLSRHAIYRYLRTCEPVEVDVTLLSVADRLATRGRGAEPAIDRHVELARQLLREALAWRRERPRPPVRGDELMRELGVGPGPRLGQVLVELEQAAFAGELAGREQAIERARALLHRPGAEER
ncbi:MAG: HD domain-containing protein [Actinomycetota bacterium]|nr:HD domain-containing protein [Actinomycetota bacterium]